MWVILTVHRSNGPEKTVANLPYLICKLSLVRLLSRGAPDCFLAAADFKLPCLPQNAIGTQIRLTDQKSVWGLHYF